MRRLWLGDLSRHLQQNIQPDSRLPKRSRVQEKWHPRVLTYANSGMSIQPFPGGQNPRDGARRRVFV